MNWFSLPTLRELVLVGLLLIIPTIAHSQSAVQPGDITPMGFTGSLEPGDFILVKIWREPDLSDSVEVDNSGVAVFPKLGPIPVTGIRPDSLERLLVHEYSEYLRNPSIRVTVLRRITIWGAVQRPGTYPVSLTMKITDALALAGGANSDGKSDKVELRRGSTRKTIDLSAKTERVSDLSLRSGDQLFVPQRSWASRNLGLIVATVGTVTSVLYFVVRR